jgi:hypothetical protein
LRTSFVRPREKEHSMQDSQDGQLRYLVHFDDGGSGMRRVDALLEVGYELRDGGARYRVVQVEHPPNPNAFGHAWGELVE